MADKIFETTDPSQPGLGSPTSEETPQSQASPDILGTIASPEDLAQIGFEYLEGDVLPQDYDKAFECFRASAEQGCPVGQRRLGYMYAYGYGTEEDSEKAFELFQQAADQGDDYGQDNLGQCYYYGHGIEQDYAQAFEWFRKSAEQGCDKAEHHLGRCYSRGQGVEQDYAKAAEWLHKAAEHGNAHAQYDLGWCYRRGEGVEKDYIKAAEWFRKAAEQGLPEAQRHLSWCYRTGEGADYDDAEADRLLLTAAEQGDTGAQNDLGRRRYMEGDYEGAVMWFKKAADQGDLAGRYNLALCREFGYGLECDPKAAFDEYLDLAEEGLPEACYVMGLAYVGREGRAADVDVNYPEGIRWMEKAAELDHRKATLLLASWHRLGSYGLDKDIDKARMWLHKVFPLGTWESWDQTSDRRSPLHD